MSEQVKLHYNACVKVIDCYSEAVALNLDVRAALVYYEITIECVVPWKLITSLCNQDSGRIVIHLQSKKMIHVLFEYLATVSFYFLMSIFLTIYFTERLSSCVRLPVQCMLLGPAHEEPLSPASN